MNKPKTAKLGRVVAQSTVRLSDEGKCSFASSIGTLRNQSTGVTAEDVYLEVRYFDVDGVSSDAEGAEQARF